MTVPSISSSSVRAGLLLLTTANAADLCLILQRTIRTPFAKFLNRCRRWAWQWFDHGPEHRRAPPFSPFLPMCIPSVNDQCELLSQLFTYTFITVVSRHGFWNLAPGALSSDRSDLTSHGAEALFYLVGILTLQFCYSRGFAISEFLVLPRLALDTAHSRVGAQT